MKKFIKYISVLALASMVFSGCEKFLDTVSYTENNTSNFPASETDALQMITGIYNVLNGGIYEPSASYFMTAMASSDECFGGGGADDYDIQAYDHFLYAGLDSHLTFWQEYYNGITRANMAIANLDKVENEEMRNQLMGEAYFLRSFLLFELAQMFGDVPLVTNVPNSVVEASEYPAPGTTQEIYGTIAAGLKKAIEIMPSKPWNQCVSGLRHATKWDAEGILARVYLFYTGFYGDKNGENITALPLVDLESGEIINEQVGKDFVVRSLEDCIANSGHSLVKDFRLMWPYTNSITKKDYLYAKNIEGEWYTDDINPEEMFSVCVTNLSSSSRYGNKFDQYMGVRKRSNYELNAFPFSRGYGWVTANPYIWDQWDKDEPGDIRKQASIFSIEEELKPPYTYTWGNDSQYEETGYWQKKYQTWGALGDNGKFMLEFSSMPAYGGTGKDLERGHSPQNLQILRFADVLLMHSELTDGKVIYNGKSGMNAVRARAGLADKAYSVDAIRKERQHELCYEGIRWTDMRRYGKAYCIAALETQLGQPIKNSNGPWIVMKDQGPGYKARYEATWGFRPFPQSEISLSAGVLKQNDGWTDPAQAQYTNWK
ncbi:MAG: RagB/SusD family nutrient uptake outer membrane protein [Bacteroidales bacterium]|nr:RagB/SusD family nutrient uptake outer membrane protein [Bacteroidales bacterium]